MRTLVWVSLISLIANGWEIALPSAFAEEAPPESTVGESEGSEGDGADGDDGAPPPPSAPKARRFREKEAEGSQAPNRFEADPVIKSRYQLNGQPLEVDPD